MIHIFGQKKDNTEMIVTHRYQVIIRDNEPQTKEHAFSIGQKEAEFRAELMFPYHCDKVACELRVLRKIHRPRGYSTVLFEAKYTE